MRIVEPDYYRQFQCAAGRCPDTCCTAWQVILDEDTLEKYNRLPGDFGDRVRSCIRLHRGQWMMSTQQGRCPMLTGDGLCAIQLHGTQDDLCKTCREYPRFVSEYGLLQERGLSLSCPEVCKTLLERQEPVCFLRGENDEPLTGVHDLDAQTFLYLHSAREEALRLAQNRSLTVSQRAAAILIFAERLQSQIDAKTFAPVPLIPNFSRYALRPAIVRRTVRKWLNTLLHMEALPNGSLYSRVLSCLDTLEDAPTDAILWPVGGQTEAEQLLVYYVYKFFLRGAYRGDILLKAKLICFFYCTAQLLLGLTQRSIGAELTLQHRVELIHSLARELEHSELNLDRLQLRLSALNCFSVDSFLRILLQRD